MKPQLAIHIILSLIPVYSQRSQLHLRNLNVRDVVNDSPNKLI